MSTTQLITRLEPLELFDDKSHTRLLHSLGYRGSLDRFAHEDATPAIGREYSSELQLADLITASDEVLRDLAYTVSSRGVVFLKAQSISPADMQTFLLRFHKAAGAPLESGLHVHPSLNVNGSESGVNIQKISSEAQKKAGGSFWRGNTRKFRASNGWHTDVSFEPCPADYSMLKLVKLPANGGDTLFASADALYERLSPSFAAYLETLSAVHAGQVFIDEVERNGGKLYEGERGHPLNVTKDLSAVHPVIRTNPVTGRRGVFVNREFTKRILGVTDFESRLILDFLFDQLVHNHDLQVRFKWQPSDLALWDNRSTWHCATFDFVGEREGARACTVGEKPFFQRDYGT